MVTEQATNSHVPRPRTLSSTRGRADGLPVPGAYGRFWLVERLGSGGMAEVYRAHEGEGGRSIVVKRLKPKYLTSESAMRLFVEEARLAASIHHPNIVRVFGLERLEGGDVFMTMEHVDGSDLRWLLNMARRRGRRLPMWLSLHIVSEVLGALDYLSELEDSTETKRNVVHCDVTPENIFISSDGHVKLGDFGVAVEDARPQDFHLGQLRGKLPYCSPEQARGERLDARSDVYSAAAVLWECLTGRPLVSIRDQEAARAAILSPQRPRPSTVNRGVPGPLDDLVLAALAPERARRTPGARVLRGRLRRLLEEMHGPVSREDVVEGMTAALAPGRRPSAPEMPAVVQDDDAVEQLLLAPAPEVQRPVSPAELPEPDVAYATFIHFEGRSFGPMALSDALARLEARAHLDLERWGVSIDERALIEAHDVLRVLGTDMGAASAAGSAAFEVSLSVQPLASLFGQVAHTRSSGIFVLTHDGPEGLDERHVRLAEGRLLDIWGARSTIRMWSALTRPHFALGDAFAGAVHRALAAGRSVHEGLHAELQDELQQARLLEVQRQLEELFSWEDGVARFVPVELPSSERAPALDRLVPELVLQTHDEARLVGRLQPHLTSRVTGAPGLDEQMQSLGLLEAELQAVRRVLEASTLAEGLMSVADEARAVGLATIYSLHAIGLLRFV